MNFLNKSEELFLKILNRFTNSKDEDLKQYLLRGSVGVFLLHIFSLGVGFLSTGILTNYFGPSNYGVYTYILSVVSLLGGLAVIGLNTLVVREVAKNIATKDWAILRGLKRFSFLFVFGSACLLAVFAFLFVFKLDFIRSSIPSLDFGLLLPEENKKLFYLALIILPFLALTLLFQAFLRGGKRVVQSQLADRLIRPVLIFISILFLGPIFNILDLSSLFVLLGFLYFISFLINYFLANKFFKESISNDSQQLVKERQILWKPWSKSAVVFFAMGSLSIINVRLDVILLGSMATAEDVGIYSIAAKLAELLKVLLMVANTVLAPQIASYFSSKAVPRVQALLTKSVRTVFILSFPLAILLILGGNWLLALFGEEFTSGYTVLAILVFAQMINVAFGSVANVLNMSGREHFVFYGLVAATLANIILSFILIPRYGIEGAAYATSASLVSWNLILWIINLKHSKVDPSIFGILIPIKF